MSDPAMMEYRVGKLEEAVRSIADSLQTLTELEVHHNETREAITRAFSEIRANRIEIEESCDKVQDRLRYVELQLPILKMTSRWVMTGTLSIIGAVFATCGTVVWAVLPLLNKGG